MDPLSEAEVRQANLEKEQEALQSFLQSEGYHAAQRVNQSIIDEHVQTLVDLAPDEGGVALYLFKITHIIADIRTKMDFKTQFTDRMKEIDDELKNKPKK